MALACQPATPPPDLNAIDPSLQCEAGKIGWDFSSGGTFDSEVRNPTQSNEIKVVDVTYGENCGATPSNWLDKFASTCNGRAECTRQVFLSGDVDPAGGCSKDFRVRYQCGVEDQVYELYYRGEAAGNQVTLRCGEKITITRASYGKNCNPSLEGNLTAKFTAICSGVRRCAATKTGNEMFGGDPAYGCGKETEVNYVCGNDPAILTAIVPEDARIDFQCAMRPALDTNTQTLEFAHATFGGNCSGVSENNVLARYQSACSGRNTCTTTPFGSGMSDPAPGCGKALNLTYKCTGDTVWSSVYGPPEAANFSPNLRCGAPITVTKAEYGRACSNAPVDFTGKAKQDCDNRRNCGFERRSANLFGSDPCPGTVKQSTFTYTCGGSSVAKTVTFGENDWIRFDCEPQPAPATYATGIRIDSATYGKNCSNGANLQNNQFQTAVNACYGRDSCSFAVVAQSDPSPNCAKDFDVTYHCGEESTTRSLHLGGEAAGKLAALQCAPIVKVRSATYGANCGKSEGNATNLVAEACNGKRGGCDFVVQGLGDPAPNCGT